MAAPPLIAGLHLPHAGPASPGEAMRRAARFAKTLGCGRAEIAPAWADVTMVG